MKRSRHEYEKILKKNILRTIKNWNKCFSIKKLLIKNIYQQQSGIVYFKKNLLI